MAASRIPLVVVLGATGAGKSKLAIEIAKCFKGEIISADSMQIYKGLDIISNKVTAEEQEEAPHHLISYLEPERKHYNVVDFRDAALPIINDLISRSIIPIVVGGTNYYIEGLLWDFLINKGEQQGIGRSTSPPQVPLTVTDSIINQPTLKQDSPRSNTTEDIKSRINSNDGHTTCKKPKLDMLSEDLSEKCSPSPTTQQRNPQPSSTSTTSLNTLPGSSSWPSFTPQSTSTTIPTSPSTHTPTTSTPTTDHTKIHFSWSHKHDTVATQSNTKGRDNAPYTHDTHTPGLLPDASSTSDYPGVHAPTTIDASNQENPARQETSPTSDNPGVHTPTTIDASNQENPARQETSPTLDYNGVVYDATSSNVASSSDYQGIQTNVASAPDYHGSHTSNPSQDYPGVYTSSTDEAPALQPSTHLSPMKELSSLSAAELYARLEKVDPETASRQHPNNTRKVLRALQVYYETGRKLSSLLEEQHQGRQDAKSGPLRYADPCILWVKCKQPELDQRLDSRVDTMMEKGLLAELEGFYEKAQALQEAEQQISEDKGYVYPHGILQMLGFKEFMDYLKLAPDIRTSEHGQNLFNKGVDDMKQATRRYAKQQVRWITNRFCARPGSNVPPVYSVDSTDLNKFDEAVQQAIQVVKAYTLGETPAQAPEPTQRKVDSSVVREVCDVCGGRVFLHLHEWTGHLKSKKHRHNVRMARKRSELSGILAAREIQLRGQQGEREECCESTCCEPSRQEGDGEEKVAEPVYVSQAVVEDTKSLPSVLLSSS